MRLLLTIGLAIGLAPSLAPSLAHGAPEAPPTSGVIAAKDAQQQVAPHGKARIAHLVAGRLAYVGKLTLAPNAKVPEHADADEEYIHVLEGSGSVTIDGKTWQVGPGSTIYMAAGAKVSFENGPAPMVAIQIFAGPGSAQKYQNWKGAD